MNDAVQNVLDELAGQYDHRLSVFDLQIQGLDEGVLTLSGDVLEAEQLTTLQQAFSQRFADLRLDTASINILQHPGLPCFHVATNLTGLYEKPTFGVPLVSELTYGLPLEILKEQGRWVYVRQKDGYLGWAYKPYLAEGEASPVTHMVLTPSYELRLEPDAASPVVTRLLAGTDVRLEETRGEWARVAANKTGWIPLNHLRAIADLPADAAQKRQRLVEDAMRMIGVPYLWGGSSGNGIDCSGFARLLHHWIGIEIPRDADMQCHAAYPVEPPFEVGDLFFFAEDDDKRAISHVGISLGGWKLIHSSRSRNGVYLDDLQERKSLMDIYARAGSFLRSA